MRAQLIASEVAIGLRRNPIMTIAVVLTVTISLALFGSGLLLQQQVHRAKDFWYDKVEVSVFLCDANSTGAGCAAGAVTQTQRDDIQHTLEAQTKYVSKVFYESKQEAFQHFEQQFKGSAIAQNVTADSLPESFRVKLKDPRQYVVIASLMEGRPGVDQVQDQRALLDKFFRLLRYAQYGAWIVSLAGLAAAALLVANSVIVAAYSRRREIGIMRLVGASRLYVQLPFIIQGVIAGIVGAGLALAGLAVVVWAGVHKLQPQFGFFRVITFHEYWFWTSAWVFLAAMVLTVVPSFIAMQFYSRS